MAFEEAARSRSDGPSRMQGGDVGFFAFQGTMPAAFAAAAFKLERGVISPPVRTPFGVHLIEVTDEQPGLLSLEDVRSEVMAHFSKTFWDETVRSERAQGGVVIPEAPPVPQTRDQ
jgi:parvulin-like peptidyl-prolyl isomerase